MKKSIIPILILALFIAKNTQAQDSTKTKIREYHLSFVNLSPLNIQLKYKRQIRTNTFFKMGIIDLSARMNSLPSPFKTNQTYYSAGIQAGIEFRKNITKNFNFFHGPDIGYKFAYSEFKVENPTNPTKITNSANSYFANYNLGIMFNITPNVLITGEINPGIYFTTYQIKPFGKTINNTFGFNIQNIGLISIAYRLH